MGKTDRTVLTTNNQEFGQVGDPNKLEASITHAYDKIDENVDERIAFQTSLQSTTDGNSGADYVKATPLNAQSGDSLQAIAEYLLAQIQGVSQGAVADGSITEAELAATVVSKLNPTDLQILAKILNVDGAGSGLDADTLDGKQYADVEVLDSTNLYNNSNGSSTSSASYSVLQSVAFPLNNKKLRTIINSVQWQMATNAGVTGYGKISIQIGANAEVFYPERTLAASSSSTYTETISGCDSLDANTNVVVRLYAKVSGSNAVTVTLQNVTGQARYKTV